MVNSSTLRAASRLSPRMIAYHLKRAARNRLAGRFPRAYAAYIDRVAADVPRLTLGATPAPSKVARQVAAFYHDEYIDQIDAAADGSFTFFGQTVDFGGPEKIDWHHELPVEKDLHLWRMKLCHMGFSCAMLVSGNARQLSALGQMIETLRPKARFDRPGCFSSYWFPYSVSHRILSLLSGYLIARETRDLPQALCRQIEDFLRWNAGFVLANIEHELKNNHVERNLAALCLYLNHTASVPHKLARRLDRDVADIIRACILDDGLLAERSAMYQGLSVMALQVFAGSSFLSQGTRALAADMLGKAERGWAFMTHPDGKIALFNDSWFDEVPDAQAVMHLPAFAPTEILPDAGYARLSDGKFFALMDAGPIGPRWNPGHGHADFLSLEVDLGQERFIVDPGTFQYSTGPRRAFERAAKSHNGPACDGVEPVDYHGCFRVGRMVAARFNRTAPDETGVRGELHLEQGVIRRAVRLLPANGGIAVADDWSAGLAKGVVRLLIPAEWALAGFDDQQATFSLSRPQAEPVTAVIRIDAGRLDACEEGEWACHYLKSEKATRLVLRPTQGGPHDAHLAWRILTG